MKGILQAITFYILMLGISVGLMYYVSLDLLRSQSITILKQGLQETMEELKTMPVWDREENLASILEANFALRRPVDERYEVEVLAFNADPLALKCALNVYPIYRPEGQWYRFEEIIIEVQS